MLRFAYTIIQALIYRKKLKNLNNKKHCIKSILEIDKKFLDNRGIKYLALDFDGVLATHGKNMQEQEFNWLKNISKEIGKEHIFILSNKPIQARKIFFAKYFPEIRFIKSRKKKPYPNGLFNIQESLTCSPEEICLVDDRLLTGCLASLIALCYPILVTKPLVNNDKWSIYETFFKTLRYLEQKIYF